MRSRTRTLALPLVLAIALSTGGAAAQSGAGQADAGPADVAFADLAPILQARCVMCHGAGAPSAGLRLDDVEGLRAGSGRGPVVVPGDPDASELVRRLRGESLPRMPLTGPPYLSDEEIDLFVRWIAAGAADGTAAATTTADPASADTDPITFARIEPILVQNCVRCHTASGVMGPAPEGYRLDSYAEVLRADDRARIVPFAPDASELVRRVRGHALPRMPLGGQLTDADIDLLVAWIADGARDADGAPAPVPVGAEVRLHGTWRADGTLDGLVLDLAGARVDDDARPGAYAEVRAVIGGDGALVVERVRAR